jgi:pyruvate formate lyase activating enzyme
MSASDMHGYIFDLKRYAIHDGPGIRTTVFFKGCPLRCRWCHNPESWKGGPEPSLRRGRCIRCGRCVKACPHDAISLTDGFPVTDVSKCVLCGVCLDHCLSDAREIVGRRVTIPEVMVEIEKDVIFYDQSGGGATFSGGEVLMQPDFLLGLLDACRARQIHTAIDTTCYAGADVIQRVANAADLFLIDIKHMDSDTHARFTGVHNERILANTQALAKAGKAIFIRIPIVPGFNDDIINLENTARFVKSLRTVNRVDILPYNRGGLEKSVRLSAEFELMQTTPPDESRMEELAAILRGFGFEVKIGG